MTTTWWRIVAVTVCSVSYCDRGGKSHPMLSTSSRTKRNLFVVRRRERNRINRVAGLEHTQVVEIDRQNNSSVLTFETSINPVDVHKHYSLSLHSKPFFWCLHLWGKDGHSRERCRHRDTKAHGSDSATKVGQKDNKADRHWSGHFRFFFHPLYGILKVPGYSQGNSESDRADNVVKDVETGIDCQKILPLAFS